MWFYLYSLILILVRGVVCNLSFFDFFFLGCICMNEMNVCYTWIRVLCAFGEAISPSPLIHTLFGIEETTVARSQPLHPPTQRIPICSPAWGALDFVPLPPQTFFLGWFETGSVFLVFGWGGNEGGRLWVWEVKPDEMTKMCLRALGVYLHHFLCWHSKCWIVVWPSP